MLNVDALQIYRYMTNLLVKEDRVEEEVNLALSAFILAVSRFLVSENWVAMTTRHKLIIKNEPTYVRTVINSRQKTEREN